MRRPDRRLIELGRQLWPSREEARALAVGVGLGAAATGAAVLGLRCHRQHAAEGSFILGMALVWDDQLHPPFADDSIEGAQVAKRRETGQGGKLLVVGTPQPAFDDFRSRSEGVAALAYRDRDGLWHPGVASYTGQEFGEISDEWGGQRAAAVFLGSTATHVALGVMDETRFVGFPTQPLDVLLDKDVTEQYPGVPLIPLPVDLL